MKKPFFILFLSFFFGQLQGQTVSKLNLVRVLKLQDSLRHHLPIEKLYLQTDKTVYAIGDTIWFKSYLFDADYLRYSSRSGIIYIELANDSNEVVFRRMLPSAYGISHGQIAIDGKDIPENHYTLRAYTNWQRNFGEEYFFTKSLLIIRDNNPLIFVKLHSNSTIINGKLNVQTTLELVDVNKHALIFRDIQLKVNDGNRNLFRGNVQTDITGVVNMNFNLPDKANRNNLTIQADVQKGNEHQRISIPLILPNSNIDLQFMPEGGDLVAGIQTTVGFKAVGEDGKGINVSGSVINSRQELISTFSSLYSGMGRFTIKPQSGESYAAKILLPNGETQIYQLPEVKKSGTVLNINNQSSSESDQKISSTDLESIKNDSLIVQVTISPDSKLKNLYLIGKSREVICYAKAINLDNNIYQSVSVSKKLFPTGIAHFVLLNQEGQPLNERIVYINHNDNLNITLKPNKQSYAPYDSVALNIKVTNKTGKPVQGSFSLAVTNDNQVRIDSMSNNLLTYLLLTSDLKGTIENPGYYLQNKNKQELDNLLLTQGWIGYDWSKLNNSTLLEKFKPEQEFTISGKVVNLIEKPIEGSTVIMLPKKSTIPKITKTDSKGRFMFNGFPVLDTTLFFFQATNKNGNNFGISISIDQTPPPEVNKPRIRYVPWHLNIDTLTQSRVSKEIINRVEKENLIDDHLLNQVEIKAKKIIKNSYNRNGPGEADLVLDEKDMEKANDMTLEEMLSKYLPTFRVSLVRQWNDAFYMSQNKVVVIIIDGVNTKAYGNYSRTKPFLDNYTAKDIKGIEVMTSINYRSRYDPGNASDVRDNPYFYPYLSAIDAEIGCKGCPPARMYVEITTYSGDGPFLKKTPGTYVYRPLPFILPKQFYRPKYADKTPVDIKDLRSTIHWEPLVITDKDGNATVSFYASDRPNNYTVVMEGSDMNGNIGSIMQKLLVK